jgi:hypothetical protein
MSILTKWAALGRYIFKGPMCKKQVDWEGAHLQKTGRLGRGPFAKNRSIFKGPICKKHNREILKGTACTRYNYFQQWTWDPSPNNGDWSKPFTRHWNQRMVTKPVLDWMNHWNRSHSAFERRMRRWIPWNDFHFVSCHLLIQIDVFINKVMAFTSVIFITECWR